MTEINEDKLNELSGHVMNQTAGAMGVLLAYIGDQLGLYKALRDSGPMSSEELAAATQTSPRYVLEWLNANAAGGYVMHDPATDKFHLTPEQAVIFANEGEPGCMQGFFQVVVVAYLEEDRNREAFRTDKGIPWSTRHPQIFEAVPRLTGPLYQASLFSEWLPALDGVQRKLENGAKVADVACGFGGSTISMAKAFPQSEFHGYDFHEGSIERASQNAQTEGATNAKFAVTTSSGLPSRDYDFITIFDAFHDMGDPLGAASHLRECLKPDGTLMVIEPVAGDTLSENTHVMGQAFYGFSTMFCTAMSKAQDVGLALGAQAGPKRLTGILSDAGFSSTRIAATSPVFMVLEARP